ncbi:DNA-directed RNA polymerase I subunit RPA43 [Bombina bombina]|uniref:DNA-directed RNA polymerase I subunit RPA43 n=1 Tax=Bombina bombina TaxID=8345 RepID=UPI00235A72BA|nr:DNA-directed RNA polymerase I subunit RPA43 [Bombina bombina]
MAESEKPVQQPPAQTQPSSLSCVELPSFADACRLVNSKYSCLVVETHRRHLALSPKYLKKKRSGIQEQLNTELLKYNVGLEGVPVAYDNIKLVGELGDIYDDLGHIHINVEADFVIFRPDYGQKLVGVVNKVAPSHIGCLVHGCFNASIPKPFKMPIEVWQHIDVKMDDQLEFDVFHLDSDAIGVFCIRGNLDKSMENKAVEALQEANANQSENPSDNTEIVTEDTSVQSTTETNEKPKKKSKKRKYQDTLVKCELEIGSSTSEVNAAEESLVLESSSEFKSEVPQKKRKKQKHQDKLALNNPSDADDVEENSVLLVDDKSLLQVKKSKKKKHRELNDSSLDQSLQNGITNNESLAEVSGFEPLSDSETGNSLENTKKKKHKKKHKDPIVQDPDKGIDESVFIEHADESLISQDPPKKKKHKRKCQERLIIGSDSSGYQSDSKIRPSKMQFSGQGEHPSLIAVEQKRKRTT